MKRRITIKVRETLEKPSFTGQKEGWTSAVAFLHALIARAIAITAMAKPKSRGKNPGPGLSMVPRGNFIDSNSIKTASRMSNRLVIFSAMINIALHKCPHALVKQGGLLIAIRTRHLFCMAIREFSPAGQIISCGCTHSLLFPR